MRNRLGKDHFERTNELRVSSVRIGGAWNVCEEYEVQKVPADEWLYNSPEGLVLQGDSKIVSKYPPDLSHWTSYNPISDTPDLFLKFARLHDGNLLPQSILDWVRHYGFLGVGEAIAFGFGPEEATETIRQYIKLAAAVLAGYEAVLNHDEVAAKKAIFEDWSLFFTVDWSESVRYAWRLEEQEIVRDGRDETIATVEKLYGGDYLWYLLAACAEVVEEMLKNHCWPILRVEEKPSDTAQALGGWGIRNLLGAMYLQMYWLMGAGGDVTRCRYCGRIISLTQSHPAARKVRQDKRFCDNACRQRHHYHTKTKPKRRGELS